MTDRPSRTTLTHEDLSMTPHFRAFLLGLVVLALALFICMTTKGGSP